MIFYSSNFPQNNLCVVGLKSHYHESSFSSSEWKIVIIWVKNICALIYIFVYSIYYLRCSGSGRGHEYEGQSVWWVGVRNTRDMSAVLWHALWPDYDDDEKLAHISQELITILTLNNLYIIVSEDNPLMGREIFKHVLQFSKNIFASLTKIFVWLARLMRSASVSGWGNVVFWAVWHPPRSSRGLLWLQIL